MNPGWVMAVALVCGACEPRVKAGADASAGADAGVDAGADAEGGADAAADCAGTASLEERAAEARRLYGDTVRTALVDGAFLFVDPDHGPLFDEATRFAPRVLAALRNGRIGVHPLSPVSVYLFASAARFRKHCTARRYVPDSGPDWGIYDPRRREIVVDLSRGRDHVPSLAHELSHVLMDADVKAPRWFRECIGTLYEAPTLPREGEIHGTSNWRYEQLRTALVARDPEAHLGALFGMSDDTFRGDSDAGPSAERYLLHYAIARATCQKLDEAGQLWPFYQGWRDELSKGRDPDGTASFERATGQTPAAADPSWRSWAARTK